MEQSTININIDAITLIEESSGNSFEMTIDLNEDIELNKEDFLNFKKEDSSNTLYDLIYKLIIERYDEFEYINEIIKDEFYSIFAENNYWDISDISFEIIDEEESELD